MSEKNSKTDNKSQQPKEEGCCERDNATQKTINSIKQQYCDLQYAALSGVKAQEIAYKGCEDLYKKKENKYLRTMKNYERYVNVEMNLGTQLIQANGGMTKNMTNYQAMNTDLGKKLKDLFDAVKDAKSKTADLRDAMLKLENSRTDSCYCTQWSILTGKNPDCKDENKPSVLPEGCKDIETIINELFCMPKALSCDVDSIFKASSDVKGIQLFCNVSHLVNLQTDFSAKAQAFDAFLKSVITSRKADVDGLQKDLVKAIQDRTDAVISLYNQRCDYEGCVTTVEELCCPECNCVDDDDICEPRLEGCEDEICEICGFVKNTYDDTDLDAPAPSN